MGCFSWLDCKDDQQILSGKYRDVFVLIPQKFGGGSIKESMYNGYGDFGGCDMYELVADWNRNDLDGVDFSTLATPKKEEFHGLFDFEKEEMRKNGLSETEINRIEDEKRQASFSRALKKNKYDKALVRDFGKLSDEDLEEKYGDEFKRELGILIACYDEDNAKLKYPIKITYDANAVYEDCKPSLGDPNQGCPPDDDDDDWY